MPRRKVNYKEGDWIALPLVDRGGWGLGLVARCKSPTIIGYFFGPRRKEPPTMADTVGLRRDDAIVVGDVGDLGMRLGEWLVVGSQPNWNRADWPMPLVVEKDGPRLYLTVYDDDDLNRRVRYDRTTTEEALKLGAIPAVVHGHEALSITLDKRLAEREGTIGIVTSARPYD
jgi:hypothetical protein